MSIEGIIFDNDGVLVDSEVIHVAVERELLAEHGLEYSDEAYMSRFVGLSMPDYFAALDADFRAAHERPLPANFADELRARAWPRIQSELQPDLFLLAARELAIDPRVCLVIEDSVHGVVAARAAGMAVIGFTGGGHADAALADRLRAAGATTVADSHDEIARLWKSGFDLT